MKQAIRKNAKWVATIFGLIVVSGLVASYVLAQQHVRVPLISASPLKLDVAMDTAESVTPGQGQQVMVAGVRIGRIADVALADGHAVLKLEIEPRFKDLVHTDAHALLRPRTGLKDMYVQLLPGSGHAPLASDGTTIPMRNTATDVDIDQILGQLDARTRDYVTLLADGAGRGLKGEGSTLAEVFRRYEPTVRDLALVNRSVSGEQASLRNAVTALARLNGRLAKRPRDLSQLVNAASTTFDAIGSEDDNLRATVGELPDTLRRATVTLGRVTPLAKELGPAATALRPAVRALNATNAKLIPFATSNEPVIRTKLRPFAREARPLVQDLRPAASSLSKAVPELQRGGVVLNHFLNMLGYNKDGRQGPDVSGRDEGYLFWLAWVAHQTVNLFNVDDANGPMRPIFLTGTCGTLSAIASGSPLVEFGLNLSPVLASVCHDPSTPSVNLGELAKTVPGLQPRDFKGLVPADKLPKAIKEAGR
jgi:phospholipid/cholesterol/gamma-HCH transport system substrate-binding protein